MRKVVFRRFVPARFEEVNGRRQKVFGTACYSKDFDSEGVFHGWGCAYEMDKDNSFGNYTVALVETEDGVIHEVIPSMLKFVEPIQPAVG